MAAPLSRVGCNILLRKQLSFTRSSIIVHFAHYPGLRELHSQQQKRGSFNRTVTDFLTCTVLLSGIGYVLYKNKHDIQSFFGNRSTILPVVHAFLKDDIEDKRSKYNFIADVVEKSAPSVVYVEIKDRKRTDFFTGKPLTVSNGSGFIVGEDGLIVTNAHVVVHKPNSTISVRLHDGTTYIGVVEDFDLQSDLATIRITKTNLPVMKLGSSSTIRPGEFVVAMGSPLSLSNTITSGVVSSVRSSKDLGLPNKAMEYIQTDAAITFGNSGGPLVNLNGEAIGINVMKLTAGISFAIPIDYVKDFLKKADSRRKSRGHAPVGVQSTVEQSKKRYLGVTMLTLTPGMIIELQQRSGHFIPNIRHGVFIYKVAYGSPSYNGGVRAGDIITHINDEPIKASEDIYRILENPGTLHLTIIRDGQLLHLAVEPEET